MSALESFSWFRSDVKATTSVGNKVRIKGKALFPTISGNKRQYIADELLRAARTLANVPIDVNHEYDLWQNVRDANEALGRPFNEAPPKYKGNVVDADYEDGYVEYVAEINHPEYAQKIRDRQAIMEGGLTLEAYRKKWGKDPIYGVSISASYRSSDKMGEVNTPHGIIFRRLSLVEEPEKPGVQGTTLSVMETLNEQSIAEASTVSLLLRDYAPSLVESYQQEVMNKMTGKEFPIDNGQLIGALDASAKNKATESAPEAKPKTLSEKTGLSEKQLGEPFSGYVDFSDCVSKNKDKGDPEAYCGSIKSKAEETKIEAKPEASGEKTPVEKVAEAEKALESEKAEKLRDAKLNAALEAITCAGGKIKSLTEKQAETDAKVEEAKKTITENFSKRLDDSLKPIMESLGAKAPTEDVKKLQEAISTIPEGFTSVTEVLKLSAAKLAESEKRLTETSAKLASAEENIKHLQEAVKATVDLQTQITGLGAKLVAYETQLKALEKITPLEVKLGEVDKKVVDLDAPIKKLREDFENMMTHINGTFKAPDKLKETLDAKTGDTVLLPDGKMRGQ
jgi:hypothetical protein